MILNTFRTNLDFETFQIQRVPYEDGLLDQYREQYNNTHSFFRNGDFIYISDNKGQDEESEALGELVTLKVDDNPKIISSLMRHLFFRSFKDRFPQYKPIDFYPLRFFSKKTEDDIIGKYLPEGLRDRVAYKKMIEIQMRETVDNGVLNFNFLINSRRNWVFAINCKELSEQGYHLVGKDVLKAEVFPGTENVVAPNEEFIGVVTAVENDMANVITSEGEASIALESLFLKKNKRQIEDYLSFRLGEETSASIINEVNKRRKDFLSPKNSCKESGQFARSLFNDGKSKVLFQNRDGFCFTVSDRMLRTENSVELHEPTFIFDHAATQTAVQSNWGLNNYGPYDAAIFDVKTPNFLCICHKNERGNFSKMLGGLFNGMPNSSHFKSGIQKKYHFHKIEHSIEEVTDRKFESYLNAFKYQEGDKPDFVIVEIPQEFKELPTAENPYYRLKAKLLGLEIPVQFVTTFTVRNFNEFILDSMGLQIYAKLGGIPWVLPSNNSVDREIIIGIGHSWIRSSEYSGSSNEKIVGITTVMSSDGQYLFGDRIKEVDYDDYFQELLRSLKNTINTLSSEQGWDNGNTIRLIFHIFKPLKNVEFDVVKELIRSYTQFKIQFAFVTLNKRHPFKIFDPSERGKGQRKTGEFVPSRASNIFLSDTACLIQMLGAKEIMSSVHGMSSPLLIRIRIPEDEELSEFGEMLFTDLNYICQQIYSLSYLSWRTFRAYERPATLLYSELIAKTLGKLRLVNGWDADVVNYKLKRKKWFL